MATMDLSGREAVRRYGLAVPIVAVVDGDESCSDGVLLGALRDAPGAALALGAAVEPVDQLVRRLDEYARLPVEPAVEGTAIHAGHIYVYDAAEPPSIADGSFALPGVAAAVDSANIAGLLIETAECANAAPTLSAALAAVGAAVARRLQWTLADWRLVEGGGVQCGVFAGHNGEGGAPLRVRVPVYDERRLLATLDFLARPGFLPGEKLREALARVARQLAAVAARVHESERALVQQAERARVGRVACMGEVASSLAHELSQPLSAVTNYAGALHRLMEREDCDAEAVRALAARLSAQAVRAGSVLQSLKQFIVRHSLTHDRVDVAGLLFRMPVLLQKELAATGITLECSMSGDLPPLETSAAYLEQILMNLLGNAVEALAERPPGQRALRLRATRDGDRLLLAVADSAGGIAPEAQPYIFDAFFTTRPGGIGMGLTVSRSLAEVLGGKLWVESEPGRGSTFILSLPLRPLFLQPQASKNL